MPTERDPFGRDKSERLSDEQTAERMLNSGIRRVNAEGLRISFDLLSFEELIVEAGVARSAVYRRWPNKHHYYADLLRELAARKFPAAHEYKVATLARIRERAESHLLATPEGRRTLAVEVSRIGSDMSFISLTSSPAWTVHLTLTATLGTLPPEGTLQADLKTAMQDSEALYFRQLADFYEGLLGVIGYRLRGSIADELSLEEAVQLGGALVEGLSLHDITSPGLASHRWQGDVFDTGLVTEWSLPAVGFASLMMSMFEPDPEHPGTWSEQKIAEQVVQLDTVAGQIPTD